MNVAVLFIIFHMLYKNRVNKAGKKTLYIHPQKQCKHTQIYSKYHKNENVRAADNKAKEPN